MTGSVISRAGSADICNSLGSDGSLGRKGRETRQRLIEAGGRLLAVASPVDLTAVAIAKEAGTASATFYIYFRDVRHLLETLGDVVTTEMVAAFEALGVFRDRADVEADSHHFLAMLSDWWSRHHVILHYRNMEADRGEENFRIQRERWAVAVLQPLSRLFRAAPHIRAPLDKDDANAEALVMFTSMERLAAAVQREIRLNIAPDKVRAAQSRILTRMLWPESN